MPQSPVRRTTAPGTGLAQSDTRRLVGIARLAAASPQVRERAEVEYFALESRSALNRESSGRLPFAWTINPYRGCEFGCKYCYARYTHEFMEMRDGRDFERKIFAKVNAPELLRDRHRPLSTRRETVRGDAADAGGAVGVRGPRLFDHDKVRVDSPRP